MAFCIDKREKFFPFRIDYWTKICDLAITPIFVYTYFVKVTFTETSWHITCKIQGLAIRTSGRVRYRVVVIVKGKVLYVHPLAIKVVGFVNLKMVDAFFVFGFGLMVIVVARKVH